VDSGLPLLAMALMKVGYRTILLAKTFDLDPSSQDYFLTLAGRILVTDRPDAFASATTSCGLGILQVEPGARPSRNWALAIKRSWWVIQPRVGLGFCAAIGAGGRVQFLDLA